MKYNYYINKGTLMFFTLKKSSKSRRTDPASFTKPVLKAISYGTSAPNAHNTQPWFIDIISDTELVLYTKNLLPETDPPARQILISNGCFIELLSIGMSSEGYQTHFEYLPEGDFQIEPFKLTLKPVARISLEKFANKARDTLFEYINLRHSNRRPYKGDIITEQEFNAIKTLIGSTHSELIFINDPIMMKSYQEIFSKAMEIETRTRETNEETRRMFRFSEKERQEKRDGLSLAQSGLDGIIRFFAERSLHNGDSVIFNSEKTIQAVMKNINAAIYSAKGLVFFKTSANNKIDWIKTGRDFARYNLAIVKLGLVTSHYNQVIQEYPAMQPLQKEFNALSKTSIDEKIQLIVRIGRAKPTYQSWRKNISDYMLKK